MKTTILMLIISLMSAVCFSQNAPITTIQNVVQAEIGQAVNVPIIVTGFHDITAVSLTLKFNPNVLTFLNGVNTSGYGSFVYGNPEPGEVRISGISLDGVTLPNESPFCTLNFTYKGGFSEFTWYNGPDGSMCEYAGPNYEPLNDLPVNTYYIAYTPTHRRGVTFDEVTIGTQTWMTQNLNIGVMLPITQAQTDNGVIEKHCYGNISASCDTYGGLYEWGEMTNYSANTQGICPDGWHLPTTGDWTILINNLGGSLLAGRELKEQGFIHWYWPAAWNWKGYSAAQKASFATQVEGTNSSGFTALGGGYAYGAYGFSQLTKFGYWWASDKTPDGWGQQVTMTATGFSAHIYPRFMTGSTVPKFSVRCIKN